MKAKPIITVRELSKRYYIGKSPDTDGSLSFFDLLKLPYNIIRGDLFATRNQDEKTIWALKRISFDVYRGERLGIIGRNGAGKTTLLKILARLAYPTEGKAIIKGRTTALFGVGTGFKPNLTGRENIYLDASLHGLTKREIREKYDEIVEFSGIGKFINTPVKYYSKGMYTRLAFAVAAHLDPEILLLDEVLAGGDMEFQKKCLSKVEGLAAIGRTILFVSHSMGAISRLCNRCIWIEGGRILEMGDSRSVVKSYSKRMLKLQSSYHVDSLPEPETFEDKVTRPDPDSPGAALISFQISDAGGDNKEVFSREESLYVTIEYKVLRDDIPLVPVFHLYRDGAVVFTSHPSEILKAPNSTICQAKATIPGSILNAGDYDFSVAVVTPARPKWRHVWLDHILSIMIVEEQDSDRIFSGDYKGVVHPRLHWDQSVLENHTSEQSTDSTES
jgi:lipopolysaccharide transport system ATP-binding protein